MKEEIKIKMNSKDLYDYVNALKKGEKVKFRLWCNDLPTDDVVIWNGDRFEWESGKVDSEVFFNPLYDFEVVKKGKPVEKLNISWFTDDNYKDRLFTLANKVDELIDIINGGMNDL